jgi:asparagine synthase (glutamine-hydrolysing)
METYNLLQRLTPRQIFTGSFLDLIDADAPARHQRQVYERCTAASLVNRMLSYDWKYTLADNDLVKVRGAAALAGVDVGFPLLNDALVEFSLGLPPRAKLRGFRLRALFRDALADFLPREILRKKKHGFGLPFGPWLAQHAGLQQMVCTALRSLAERAIVRRELIADLLDAKLHAHAGYFGEMVWLLLVLEYWLRSRAPQFCVEPAAPRPRSRPGRVLS